MPRYSALVTVDADMSMPNKEWINTKGFTFSVTFFARSDSEAADGAWKAFENSDMYKFEIEKYVNSIQNIEITELASIESFDDSGTVVGQVVFFEE